MEWDAEYVFEVNLLYSKELLNLCLNNSIPLIYASSASVYGSGTKFKEKLENESPINLYAYSKYLFDQNVRQYLCKNKSQIVGLRYFNVFGPREHHKLVMSSVIYHFFKQMGDSGNQKQFSLKKCNFYKKHVFCPSQSLLAAVQDTLHAPAAAPPPPLPPLPPLLLAVAAQPSIASMPPV